MAAVARDVRAIESTPHEPFPVLPEPTVMNKTDNQPRLQTHSSAALGQPITKPVVDGISAGKSKNTAIRSQRVMATGRLLRVQTWLTWHHQPLLVAVIGLGCWRQLLTTRKTQSTSFSGVTKSVAPGCKTLNGAPTPYPPLPSALIPSPLIPYAIHTQKFAVSTRRPLSRGARRRLPPLPPVVTPLTSLFVGEERNECATKRLRQSSTRVCSLNNKRSTSTSQHRSKRRSTTAIQAVSIRQVNYTRPYIKSVDLLRSPFWISIFGHNFGVDQQFCAKFGTVIENRKPNGSQCSEIGFSKIQDGGRPPFWISILAHNFRVDQFFRTKFGTETENRQPKGTQ